MPHGEHLSHLMIDGRFQAERYTAVAGGGGEHQLPPRDTATHGATLRQQLDEVRQANEQARGIVTSPNNPARIIMEVCGVSETNTNHISTMFLTRERPIEKQPFYFYK